MSPAISRFQDSALNPGSEYGMPLPPLKRKQRTMTQPNVHPITEPTETKDRFSNIHPIERLVEHDMKGNPTYIGRTLKKITDIFNEHNIEFALAGALSLGLRCKPRYTVDIDLLVHPDDSPALEKLFKQNGLFIVLNDEYMMTVQDPTTGVEADLLFSPFDPEESGRATATKEDIFGVSVPVIQSEFLLWMYLLSDQEKHKIDGMDLIKSGKVNLEKLTFYLKHDEDDEALNRLNDWISKAKKESSRSYSESIKRRKPAKNNKQG